MSSEIDPSTLAAAMEQVRAETRAEMDARLECRLRVERRRSRRRLGVVAGALATLVLSLTMGPVVAGHLNVRTNDIANKAVTTKKLANGAVKPKKIKNNAVKTPKIADRAVTSTKLARYAPGMAVAGVDAQNFGGESTIHNWFNRFGGQPTVTRTSVGAYTITFPGLEGRLGPTAIVHVTPRGDGRARQFSGGTTNEVIIRTYNAAGALTDMTFNLTVTAPNQASNASARPLKGGQVNNQGVENE